MPVTLSPLMRCLFTSVIFLFIPLAIVAPHAVVWEIVIFGLAGLYYSRHQHMLWFPAYVITGFAVLLLWAMLTCLWASHPLASFLTTLKISALMASGIYACRLLASLPPDYKKSLANAFIAGLFIGLVSLLMDAWLGNPWLHFWHISPAKAFAQGSLMISLAVWPTTLWLLHTPLPRFQHMVLLGCLFFSVLYVLSHLDCDTSYVGLAAGILVFVISLWLPRLAARGMRLGIPFFMFCFPFLSFYTFKPEYIPIYNHYIHSASYIDRLYIWNDVAQSIKEHPLKGIGMNGTRYHDKAHIPRKWPFEGQNGKVQEMQTMRFGIHPHNAILELWLELGIIGFIGGIVLVYQILLAMQRAGLSITSQAIGNALFVNVFIIAWVNLGLWQSWWLSGVWTVTGLTLAVIKYKDTIVTRSGDEQA